MARPHAALVLRWPQSREACASEARRGDARALHTVDEARRADARAPHTVDVTRRGDTRARHHTVVEARRAMHESGALPSPQSATGAGKPASRSVSRTGAAHPTAAACRCGRGHRRFWSLLPRPSCRRPRGRGRRAGRGLASDPWRPVVCGRDPRDSHGRGHLLATHGPSRRGGRGRRSG
eukprot:scaffold13639_cov80-Phaeocystis_antarctica.AAC.1